jgi:hypothetical protein
MQRGAGTEQSPKVSTFISEKAMETVKKVIGNEDAGQVFTFRKLEEEKRSTLKKDGGLPKRPPFIKRQLNAQSARVNKPQS